MLSGNEKRLHSRVEFKQLVRVEPYEGNILQFIGVNYSTSGMALNGSRELELGEYVDLNFRLNIFDQREFKMTAEVIQNRRLSNMYVTGLRFLGELNI